MDSLNRRSFLIAAPLAVGMVAAAPAAESVEAGRVGSFGESQLIANSIDFGHALREVGVPMVERERCRTFMHRGIEYRLEVGHTGDAMLSFRLGGRHVVALYDHDDSVSPAKFSLTDVSVEAPPSGGQFTSWDCDHPPPPVVAAHFDKIWELVNREAQEPYAELMRQADEFIKTEHENGLRAEREATELFAATAL